MDKNNFCIIMAGGIGSRFWPRSRTALPKQFIDILGTGKTLIQQTYQRMLPICPKDNVLVVTHRDYKELVQEQLPELSEHQILCEPSRRNTAPCIAYANAKIELLNPDARIIVAPADHLVINEPEFIGTLRLALRQTDCEDCLVTVGIKPTRPDTGYGYIQYADSKDPDSVVKKVKTFTEKPDIILAKQFLESGDFYWNSGIFIWSLSSINKAFEAYLPEVFNLFKDGNHYYNTPAEDKYIEECYQQCPNESIDYGIMEKAKSVFVVLSDFGWSDLGTWGSLYTHVKHDKKGNAIIAKKARLYESSKNIICSTDKKMVVIQGLEDYIVVDTKDILLICPKSEEQKIKQIVQDIKMSKGEKYT